MILQCYKDTPLKVVMTDPCSMQKCSAKNPNLLSLSQAEVQEFSTKSGINIKNRSSRDGLTLFFSLYSR